MRKFFFLHSIKLIFNLLLRSKQKKNNGKIIKKSQRERGHWTRKG